MRFLIFIFCSIFSFSALAEVLTCKFISNNGTPSKSDKIEFTLDKGSGSVDKYEIYEWDPKGEQHVQIVLSWLSDSQNYHLQVHQSLGQDTWTSFFNGTLTVREKFGTLSGHIFRIDILESFAWTCVESEID